MTEFQFVSLDWVIWVSAATLVFWLVSAPQRFHFLALATLSFLLVHDPASCGLLIALTLMTYVAANRADLAGTYMVVPTLAILGILFFYKGLQSLAGGAADASNAIPLGLSYYSLRCVHYLIERYKGNIPKQGFQELFLYLFFLPTIWIGPIHRYPQFARDLRRHRWDGALFSAGLERILYGYVKVVLIANLLLNTLVTGWMAGLAEEAIRLYYYLEMVRWGMSLYIVFAGYSDIAIGCGYLLGFRVMENFDHPYLKRNISEFWRSWHISLTSWCREYLYTVIFCSWFCSLPTPTRSL